MIIPVSFFKKKPYVPTALGFRSDNFNSGALGSHWKMVDPNAGATFSVVNNRARMANAAGSSNDLFPPESCPILYQDINLNEDFTLTVKVDPGIDGNDYSAEGSLVATGIILFGSIGTYRDYISAEILGNLSGGNTVNYWRSFTGNWNGGSFSPTFPLAGLTPTYLRLTKINDIFEFFISNDGLVWESLRYIKEIAYNSCNKLGVYGIFNNSSSANLSAWDVNFDSIEEINDPL